MHLFWQALASFTADEQRALLRFVTSCSRAPLLGFRYVGWAVGAVGRLDTRSVCCPS